jgi:hypothetical protein
VAAKVRVDIDIGRRLARSVRCPQRDSNRRKENNRGAEEQDLPCLITRSACITVNRC